MTTMAQLMEEIPYYLNPEFQVEVKTWESAVDTAVSYAEDNADYVSYFDTGGSNHIDSETGKMLLDDQINGISEAHILPNALQQMVKRSQDNGATGLRRDYINNCPVWLAAENLNHWLSGLPFTFRLYAPKGQPQASVRAAVSDRWNRGLDNAEILKALASLETSAGPVIAPYTELERSYISNSAMYIHIPIPGKEFHLPDQRGGGTSVYSLDVIISGSETGGGALRVQLGFRRTACMNSFRSLNNLLPNHWWSHANQASPMQVAREMAYAILPMYKDSDQHIDAIVKSVEKYSVNLLEEQQVLEQLQGFITGFSLTEEEAEQLKRIQAREYADNLLGVANAATVVSQKVTDPDKARWMEQAAGELILTGKMSRQTAEVESV